MGIQIIIADDHPIIRAGLTKVLQSNPNFQLVAEVPDGKELLQKLKTLNPDMILLDLNMPGNSGLAVIPKIKEISTSIKIVVFTMHEGEGYFREAVQSGVNGYILKSEELPQIPKLLERIFHGEFYSTPPLQLQKNKSGSSRFKISQKEHEILTMLVNGFTAKEIGERIGLSKRTVEYYSRKLKEKFDAENLVELVNRAKELYFK